VVSFAAVLVGPSFAAVAAWSVYYLASVVKMEVKMTLSVDVKECVARLAELGALVGILNHAGNLGR